MDDIWLQGIDDRSVGQFPLPQTWLESTPRPVTQYSTPDSRGPTIEWRSHGLAASLEFTSLGCSEVYPSSGDRQRQPSAKQSEIGPPGELLLSPCAVDSGRRPTSVEVGFSCLDLLFAVWRQIRSVVSQRRSEVPAAQHMWRSVQLSTDLDQLHVGSTEPPFCALFTLPTSQKGDVPTSRCRRSGLFLNPRVPYDIVVDQHDNAAPACFGSLLRLLLGTTGQEVGKTFHRELTVVDLAYEGRPLCCSETGRLRVVQDLGHGFRDALWGHVENGKFETRPTVNVVTDLSGNVTENDAAGRQCLTGGNAVDADSNLVHNDVGLGVNLRHVQRCDLGDTPIVDQAASIKILEHWVDQLRALQARTAWRMHNGGRSTARKRRASRCPHLWLNHQRAPAAVRNEGQERWSRDVDRPGKVREEVDGIFRFCLQRSDILRIQVRERRPALLRGEDTRNANIGAVRHQCDAEPCLLQINNIGPSVAFSGTENRPIGFQNRMGEGAMDVAAKLLSPLRIVTELLCRYEVVSRKINVLAREGEICGHRIGTMVGDSSRPRITLTCRIGGADEDSPRRKGSWHFRLRGRHVGDRTNRSDA